MHIVSYSYSAGNPPNHRSASGSQMEGAENPFRVKRGEVPNRLSQLEVFKEQESIQTLESRLEVFHDLVFFGDSDAKKILILEKVDSGFVALADCPPVSQWHEAFLKIFDII